MRLWSRQERATPQTTNHRPNHPGARNSIRNSSSEGADNALRPPLTLRTSLHKMQIMTTMAIESEALLLPKQERAQLIERLSASLVEEDGAMIQAWLEESADRFAAYQRGALEAVDGESFVSNLRRAITE